MRESLDRHDGIHAIGSALAVIAFGLAKDPKQIDINAAQGRKSPMSVCSRGVERASWLRRRLDPYVHARLRWMLQRRALAAAFGAACRSGVGAPPDSEVRASLSDHPR
jgi:hypothetical protein